MYIYILIFIIVYGLSLIEKLGKKKIYKILSTVLPIIVLTIFSGIRYGIGSDYHLYESIYNNIAKGVIDRSSSSQSIEVGFFYMNYFANKIGFTYYQLVFFIALINMLCLVYYMRKYSSDFPLALISFMAFGIYGNTFNILRQMIGISILSLGMKYLLDRNFRRFIIFVLLASLFHRSILIMIPIYFLVKFNYKKITYYIMPMVILLLNLLGITQKIYPSVLGLSFIPQKYLNEYSSGMFVERAFNIKYVIIILIIYYLFLIFEKCIEKENSKKYLIMLNLMLILIVLGLFSTEIWVFYRLFVVLQISLVLVVPELLKIVREDDRKILKVIMLLCCLGIFVYTTNAQNGILPYKTIYTKYI